MGDFIDRSLGSPISADFCFGKLLLQLDEFEFRVDDVLTVFAFNVSIERLCRKSIMTAWSMLPSLPRPLAFSVPPRLTAPLVARLIRRADGFLDQHRLFKTFGECVQLYGFHR